MMLSQRPDARFGSDYSNLRDFLRGYMHEDWFEEYGSVREAVRTFWMDTGSSSIARVAQDWQAVQQISGGELKSIVDVLNHLGGAWNPNSAKDLQEMTEALAMYEHRPGRT